MGECWYAKIINPPFPVRSQGWVSSVLLLWIGEVSFLFPLSFRLACIFPYTFPIPVLFNRYLLNKMRNDRTLQSIEQK